jgi:hypothetical protein
MPYSPIHIISFDNPYPADYGGVIDVYHKLRWLKKMGVSVYIHIFEYGGKQRSPVLEELCTDVHYYPRKTKWAALAKGFPWIIASRWNEELVHRLHKDPFPVVMEGLHATAAVYMQGRMYKQQMIMRESNIEHQYYRMLSESEKRFAKRVYLRWEAERIERLESRAIPIDDIMAVSKEDAAWFSRNQQAKVHWIPSFHANDEIQYSRKETKNYVLYHGNLSVSENYDVVQSLAQSWTSEMPPLYIAGKNPPEWLQKQIAIKQSFIRLIPNPEEEQMRQLIQEAGLNLLISFQRSGLKLKLLNTLHLSPNILCNEAMVHGTGLENALPIYDSELVRHAAIQRWFKPFQKPSESDAIHSALELFNNQKNIEQFLSYIRN